jgi:ribosomal protein L25 (general stress protein Ctc)
MRLAIDAIEATKEDYGFNEERITAIEVDTDELTKLTDELKNSSIITIEIENNLKRKIIIEKSELKIFAEFLMERLKNC